MVAETGSIASILEQCVVAGAERRAYTNLVEGRDEGRVLSYGELYRLAAQGASLLSERLAPGERVLLLHDDSLDFMVAFLACIFAGVVAVPIPPPDATRLKRTLPRVLAVVADCQASAVLANAGVLTHLRQAYAEVGELSRLPWLGVEEFDGCPAREPRVSTLDRLAYLQYSSGSTMTPKGVMMTHGNLLANLRMIQTGLNYSHDSIAVTWMPYFHDFGLVDGLLEPLYSQIPCYVMSPVAMIKRPWRWLEAVSRFRATHTSGPNFAYQMCLDRVSDDKLAALDLSSVRTAGCGAEPVRLETVERFISRFAACGFRPEAFVPGYGLAEATLIVTTKVSGTPVRTVFLAPEVSGERRCIDLSREDARARAVVSCGPPSGTFDLCIVDPETGEELGDNTSGEIWVANPSVAVGYWNRPQETSTCFAARTRNGRGPMLRTGDLGFTRAGELYVTGRIKDLIIINGINHYPQDVEQTVEAVGPWIRATFVAVFAIERGGEERLVVAAELNGTVSPDGGKSMLNAIRSAVSQQHEIACAAIVLLPRGSLPKTSSGKIQRSACKTAYLVGEWSPLAIWQESMEGFGVEKDAAPDDLAGLEMRIRQLIVERKQLDAEALGPLMPFADLGISSRQAVEIAADLEDLLGRSVAATVLWEYPNIRALARHLATPDDPPRSLPSPAPASGAEEIAIIGMACRFPGASDSPEVFWRLINGSANAIGAPPSDRCADFPTGFQAGFIDGLFQFDAAFFGIADAEARQMDPQQRLLLTTAWHALEDAGLPPDSLAGTDTGVYVGVSGSEHAQSGTVAGEESRFGAAGNSLAIVANRLSYFLDLRGPSLSIDTACSASLVAVHQACSAMQSGDCDLALVGGVNVLLDGSAVELLQQAQMLSSRGQSRPFDALADGYVRGEGCGVVVLKPLAKARRDGNRVLAVIRASAVAQDGRSNGLTAPNGEAQRHVIRKTLARSGLAPGRVGYVEAHGTGTPLGDPIEMRALADCYGQSGSPCVVGAVKGFIGHLEGAAGIAGLIKSVLVLQHGRIPGTPWLDTINPQIELADGRLSLSTQTQDWPSAGNRVAAVSSFGFGGTLAHVILEAGDTLPTTVTKSPSDVDEGTRLLLLSAADPAGLGRLVAVYAALSPPDWSALCAGAATYRSHLPWRTAIVASEDMLPTRLRAWSEKEARLASLHDDKGGIAMVFTGQGAQRPGMGRDLYRRLPVFKAAADGLNEVLTAELGMTAESLLFELPDAKLNMTRYAQPVLLLLQLGLLRVWQHWGIRPNVLLGHSVGEFAAAVAADVLTATSAMRLIIVRARLMDELCPPGAMATFNGQADEAEALIQDRFPGLEIAAYNAPDRVAVTGTPGDIHAFVDACQTAGRRAVVLPVDRAFHSSYMAAARTAFAEHLATEHFQPPTIPILSTLTGQLAGDEIATPDYWLRQISDPVDFRGAVSGLPDLKLSCALEIGPAATLCSLGEHCLGEAGPHWLPSLTGREPDDEAFLRCLGELYLMGQAIDWSASSAETPPARQLPLYPFATVSYRRVTARRNVHVPHLPATYTCEWLELASPEIAGTAPTKLVFVGDPETGEDKRLADALRQSEAISSLSIRAWTELPNLDVEADSLILIQCMARRGEPTPDAALRLAESLLAGLRALHRRNIHCRVWAISRGSAALAQGLDSSPEAACVWGLGRVAALEMPQLWGGLLDLSADMATDDLIRLLPTILNAGREDQIALRRGRRFVSRLQTAEPPHATPLALSAELAYWVVGGSGALGQHVLGRLHAAGARQLIVSGRRREAPPALAHLNVRYIPADIADPCQVQHVLDIVDSWGLTLGGIVHAAGNASEFPIEQLTTERFREVAETKVRGAWNLHVRTAHRPLQFFVCFASVAGLWGSSGQAHYAAANHFLDALCNYRRRQQLPALAIDWGPWAGGGLVSDDVGARLAQAGLDLLQPESAMTLFDRLLGSAVSRIAAVNVRWPEFAAAFTARRESPFLSRFVPSQQVDETAATLNGSPEQVLAEIRHRVTVAVADHLGSGRQADAQRGFFDQGLDSLAVVAIHKRLVSELGIRFPRPDMFSYPSVSALSERLLALWHKEQKERRDSRTPSTKQEGEAFAATALSSSEIASAVEAEMIALGLRD